MVSLRFFFSTRKPQLSCIRRLFPTSPWKAPIISTSMARPGFPRDLVPVHLQTSLPAPTCLPHAPKHLGLWLFVEFWETETYQRSPLMGDTDMFTDNSNVLFRCHAGRLFRIQGGWRSPVGQETRFPQMREAGGADCSGEPSPLFLPTVKPNTQESSRVQVFVCLHARSLRVCPESILKIGNAL